MDYILREGYWIKFCIKLITVISYDNYYSQFYPPFRKLVKSVNSSQFQTKLMSVLISDCNDSPLAWIS
jgi:delta-aminolevulinic acid dehydratase/porphobilinogen synthase